MLKKLYRFVLFLCSLYSCKGFQQAERMGAGFHAKIEECNRRSEILRVSHIPGSAKVINLMVFPKRPFMLAGI